MTAIRNRDPLARNFCVSRLQIRSLFSTPYMSAAMVRFYDDLRPAPGEESSRDTSLQVTAGTDFEE